MQSYKNKTIVSINGNWFGFTDKAYDVMQAIKNARRKGIIKFSVSVVLSYLKRELRICTDGGRVIRPFFVVEDNKLLIKPNDLTKDVKVVDLISKGLL